MALKPDTKNVLEQSLRDLLKTKSFEKISVEEIAEHCGASRATFYRHFKDKFDLMSWSYTNRVYNFIKENKQPENWRKLFYQIMTFLYNNRNYFKAVVEYEGQNSFFEMLINYGTEYWIDALKDKFPMGVIPDEYNIAFEMFGAGTARIMLKWLKNGCNEPLEVMTDIMCRCIPAILVPLVGRDVNG